MDMQAPTSRAISPVVERLSLSGALLIPLLLLSLMIVGCDQSPGTGEKLPPPGIGFAPSNQLQRIVTETPSDFTWDAFNQGIVLSTPDTLEPEAHSDEVTVTLTALHVRGTDSGDPKILDRATSEQVTLDQEQLANGVTTEDLFGTQSWMPGADWLPAGDWSVEPDPAGFVIPDDGVDPSTLDDRSAYVNDLVSGRDFGSWGGMVVVFPTAVGGDSALEEVRPMGLILVDV